MRCPACGARYEKASMRCPECGALQEVSANRATQTQLDQSRMEEEVPQKIVRDASSARKRSRSLIEFPGVNRSTVPEWRKELGERVREAQEKRAQKALAEAVELGPLFSELESKNTPTLELLPQAEVAPMNPLVVAALRRIERAHSRPARNAAVATALAYEEQTTLELSVPTETTIDEHISKPERAHNLAVVPTPEIPTSELVAPQLVAPVLAAPEILASELLAPELLAPGVQLAEVPARVVPTPAAKDAETPQKVRKPIRVIDDRNESCLNYLDSIPTSIRVESRDYDAAPVFRRLFSAFVDLIVVGMLASPFMALTELTSLSWQNPRVIGFAAGTFLVVGFLYLTISVAFTGRTMGMKLLSLRVIDSRTGLIPTGSQAAGRSLVYLLSLASAGIALMYFFLNHEKHMVHDRFTRTAVVRA